MMQNKKPLFRTVLCRKAALCFFFLLQPAMSQLLCYRSMQDFSVVQKVYRSAHFVFLVIFSFKNAVIFM